MRLNDVAMQRPTKQGAGKKALQRAHCASMLRGKASCGVLALDALEDSLKHSVPRRKHAAKLLRMTGLRCCLHAAAGFAKCFSEQSS